MNFSDLIVRVTFVPERAPNNGPDGYVFWELLGLVLAQIELIYEGILVRGSVTIGDVYCSSGTIFGPGLVSAYQMEQKAVYRLHGERILARIHAADHELAGLIGLDRPLRSSRCIDKRQTRGGNGRPALVGYGAGDRTGYRLRPG